uniref:Uncharacterized protein n=1 Tax=Nelumbo nucifera TaxID=4432 RepID=A0A822Y3P4_NELNU|nr:TPA_asm: hypothetical protein HUJ06_027387 [Nelumbo nucifera]
MSSLAILIPVHRHELQSIRRVHQRFSACSMSRITVAAMEARSTRVGHSLGFLEPTAAAIANASAGLNAAMEAQLVWGF